MLWNDDTAVRFTFFGGKGGVGKTSVSAATALRRAENGESVLLISTDPAHSVSDAFDMEIDGETEVREGLYAVEVDPEEAMESYRDEIAMEDMPEMMEGLGMLDKTPGMDEMAAFNQFMKYMRSDEYDHIIFDTAPTGHTLNLLQLPELMDSMVGTMLKMRMRVSGAMDMVKGMFGGDDDEEEGEDPGVAQLKEMKARIEEARELLTGPETVFNFVMIPETMSLYETERAIEAVGDNEIAVGRLYVNKVLPENRDCDFCTARRSMQQQNVDDAEERFSGMEMTEIPLFTQEVHGLDMLGRMASHLD